jgi:hypothetical protein
MVEGEGGAIGEQTFMKRFPRRKPRDPSEEIKEGEPSPFRRIGPLQTQMPTGSHEHGKSAHESDARSWFREHFQSRSCSSLLYALSCSHSLRKSMLSSRTPEKKKMPKIITEWKDRQLRTRKEGIDTSSLAKLRYKCTYDRAQAEKDRRS